MRNNENQIYEKGKLNSTSEGAGISSTLLTTALDLGMKAAPIIGKKAVEAGRYYGSEAMRNPKLQKKAINFALELWAPVNKMPVTDAKKLVQYYKDQYKKAKQNGYTKSYNTFVKEMGWGAGIDIHKLIGKVPKPKGGWTPGNYKYMGPYNPLDEQLTYDPKTGKVLEWKVQPYNKVDEVAAYHDICYDMGNDKGDCDKKMVKSLDTIPYGKMPKWGQTARFLIDKKQKLGLSVKSENVKSHRVKKTGKKN